MDQYPDRIRKVKMKISLHRQLGNHPQCLQLIILLSSFLFKCPSSSAFEFRVGQHLHNFFRKILPNNTNYRRKADDNINCDNQNVLTTFDPNVMRKMNTSTELAYIIGDMKNLPTLPGNATYERERLKTTAKTTPSKESVLRLGEIFQGLFAKHPKQKDSPLMVEYKKFMREDIELVKDEEPNDEQLDDALKISDFKYRLKIEDLYNKSVLTTSTHKLMNFFDDLQDIYRSQMKNLFDADGKPISQTTETPLEIITEQITTLVSEKPKLSLEREDDERMKNLRDLDAANYNKSNIEEMLRDVYTPKEWSA